MARHTFGGDIPSMAVSVASNKAVSALNGGTVTFYTAQTGGTQVTDLLAADGVTPITSVTTGSDGTLPVFYGPDGTTSLWAAIPGVSSRRQMPVTDLPTFIQTAYVAASVAPAPSGDTSGGTDTAALQAWLNTSTLSAPLWLHLRAGTYYINTALVFPGAPGTRLTGAGRDVSIIRQVTAGQAVVRFTTNNTWGVSWDDFTLDYSTLQSNTSSNAVTYEGPSFSYFSHSYTRIRVRNAYSCYRIVDGTGSTSTWAMSWNDCEAFGIKHSVFDMNPAVAVGMPNHVINNLRVDNTGAGGTTSDGPVFNYTGVEVIVNGADLEGWHDRAFFLIGGCKATFRRIHIESHVFSAANPVYLATFGDQGYFYVDDISVAGSSTSAGTTALFNGQGTGSVIKVAGLTTNVTTTAGVLSPFYGTSGTPSYQLIGDVIVAGGTTPDIAGSTDEPTRSRLKHVLSTPATPGSGGYYNIPAQPPVSGTVYQNTTGYTLTMAVSVSGGAGAGTVQLFLGPTNAPSTWGPAVTIPASAAQFLPLRVPSGWYFKVTAGGGTPPTIVWAYMIGE